MSVIYDGVEYELRFTGREYLCVDPNAKPSELRVEDWRIDEPPSEYPDVRRKMLLLMEKYPRVWTTLELRNVLRASSPMLSAIVQREKGKGTIVSAGFGRVRLRT